MNSIQKYFKKLNSEDGEMPPEKKFKQSDPEAKKIKSQDYEANKRERAFFKFG